MGAAIFFVGMIVNAFEGFPTFHPLAMLGGALWATGKLPIYCHTGEVPLYRSSFKLRS